MSREKMVPSATKYHHGDLRRAILQEALKTIAASGVESLSLREIARRIGVSTAAPYFHFKDRQSLLIELAIDGYAELLRELRRAHDRAQDPERELQAAAAAYLKFGRAHRAHYDIMFSGLFASHQRFNEMFLISDECMDMVRRAVARMANLDPKRANDAAFCAWSLLHGIVMLDRNRILHESAAELERLAIQGAVAAVKGLACLDTAVL